jgi:hypothetical protein
MSANSELLAALQMFQQGVQQATTGFAINQARDQVNQINTQIQDEGQKRQALQNLSQDLALRLTGAGASGAQIQSAFQAVAPPNFGSAEQMQLEGQLSGNKFLQEQAGGIIGQREAKAKSMLAMEYGFKNAMEDKRFQRELMLEQMKLSKKAPPDAKPEDVAFGTNINVANKLIDDLEETVKSYGTMETGFGSEAAKKASAKLDAIPYQLAITYAKIVDPNSVAREGEVAAAQKYLLNLGATANTDKTLEALTHMRTTIQDYANARSQAKTPGGPAAATSAVPTATNPQASAALAWARANPQDPRSQEIIRRLSSGR